MREGETRQNKKTERYIREDTEEKGKMTQKGNRGKQDKTKR